MDPLPSFREDPNNNDEPKAHIFMKKNFDHPTWCVFANKFIWGLDKTGYACLECGMVCSRKYIVLAKQTVCGHDTGVVTPSDVSTAVQPDKNVFTVHLERGAKKSIIIDDPNTKLITVLQKICISRGCKLEDMTAEDADGKPVDVQMKLNEIPGKEITFISKSPAIDKIIPPFLDDLKSTSGPSDEDKPKKQTLIKKLSIKKNKNKIEKRRDGTEEPKSVDPWDDETKKRRYKQIMETYEIGETLGNGAFSVVKLVKNRDTGQEYAMKIVSKKTQDKRQKRRFMGEIEVMSSLQHPNIVQFMEIVEDSKAYYVLMELVKGGELFDQIVSKGRYKDTEAAPILSQILNALVYLHEVKHCVHRDLKPENLLFKDKRLKELKIADFGEAKNFHRTVLNTYCGTPDYMAPEVAKSFDHGPPADMWSLGVVAFVMIGGFPPFAGQTDTEVLDSICNCRYSFPSPEFDGADLAKDFISKLLVLDPNDRLSALNALDHPFIRNNVLTDLTISNEGIKKLRWGEITDDIHSKSKHKAKKHLRGSDEIKLDKVNKNHKIVHDENDNPNLGGGPPSPFESPKPIRSEKTKVVELILPEKELQKDKDAEKNSGTSPTAVLPEGTTTTNTPTSEGISTNTTPHGGGGESTSRSPRGGTPSRITRGQSLPRPRTSVGAQDSSHKELIRTLSVLNYNYDMSREKLVQLREVLSSYIGSNSTSTMSDSEFLAGYSHTVMVMRNTIYGYPVNSSDIQNDFDYKAFLDAISGYMKFLLKNFSFFNNSDDKATLMKSFDGMIRIAIAFLDAVNLASTVTNQMTVLQGKWETMLNIAGNVVFQAYRDQEKNKIRMKKIRAILKAAILRIQGMLHEINEILRRNPFNEVEYRKYLGTLVDIYNRIQSVLIPNTKNLLIQVTRVLLVNSKSLANESGFVPPERRCFIEKQIMKTVKILILAKYDNLALDDVDHPDL